MTHSFESNLYRSLEQLGKKEWTIALLKMEQNFRLIPNNETSFGDELLSTLWALHEARQQDDDLPLVNVFAIRLSKFNAWTFRFSRPSPNGKIFINPLISQQADFADSVEVSQSTTAFPAEDIIKRWARDHLV